MVTCGIDIQHPPTTGPVSAGSDESKLSDPEFVLRNEIKEWLA
jgi:hypothetical protein